MKNTGKLILVFSALFLLFGHFTVHAEKVDKTVKDCLKNPDACDNGAKTSLPAGNGAEQAGITGWEILKTVIVLFLVLGLLFLFLRWLQKRNMRVLSTGVIKHLGGTNVGMNRSVQLIRLGKSILVLGVGENVQLLKEVRDEKEVEELLRQYEESVPFQTDFKNLLLKWKDARTEKKNPVSPPPSFSGMLKRTLEEAARRRKEVLQDEEKGNRDP
jgi:flagellar protein FliO/FliZ